MALVSWLTSLQRACLAVEAWDLVFTLTGTLHYNFPHELAVIAGCSWHMQAHSGKHITTYLLCGRDQFIQPCPGNRILRFVEMHRMQSHRGTSIWALQVCCSSDAGQHRNTGSVPTHRQTGGAQLYHAHVHPIRERRRHASARARRGGPQSKLPCSSHSAHALS